MDQFKDNQKMEASTGLKEIKESYRGDFIREILETFDSIELELVNLEVDPDNTEYMNAIYCDFHTIKGLAGFLEESIALEITDETGELLETCKRYSITATRSMINILLQTIFFLRKICNNKNSGNDTWFQGEVEQHLLNIRQLKEEIMLDVRQPIRPPESRIGEILVQEGAIEQQDIEDVLEKQSSTYQKMKFGEIAIREKKVDTSELIRAIRAQKIRNENNEQYVRIPIKRLDQILEVVNQLGNIQNDLHHESVLRFGSNDVFSVETRRAENMSADIQKILRELRLITLKSPFQKLTRAVRAMIEDSGLHVVFSTVGESTELNKDVAEDLIIPLAEIVECMLTGFSSDTENEKEKMGNIEVVAYQKDNSVIIEVSNNRTLCKDNLNRSMKMEQVQGKLDKIKGRLEYEETDDDGCKVKIVLAV